jgi:hypothetical protein
MPLLVHNEPARAVSVEQPAVPARRLAWWCAGLLAALLVIHVPAFLCLPLDADVSEWDLCARTVLRGGTFYKDALENNFPGMLWLHLAIRPVVGWTSEAMRAVDLAVVAAIVVLLLRWLPAGASAAARLATAGALAALYLSASEWCHCQRDTWMLLPALLALELRRRQVHLLLTPSRPSPAFALRPVLEGLLWAAGFWIKPFIAVPALLCWLAAARQVAVTTPGRGRWLALDGVLWLVGGLLAAAAGCAWLMATGAWDSFWEVMSWNRQYVVHDISGGERWLVLAGFALRLSPWLLVHLVALPLACRELYRANRPDGSLLSALYIGWLIQAAALQHLYDYVHVPALLLGLTVLCRHIAASVASPARTTLAALLLMAVALRLAGLTAQRLALWDRCVREGSSTALCDHLSLLPRTNWAELEGVRVFLQERGVQDGELTCYSMRTLPLYLELGVRPSTRYFLLENVLTIFGEQRGRIVADLAASGQRYFVCDLKTTSWRSGHGPGEVRFPENAILYQSGRYAVFALDGRSMPAWLEEHVSDCRDRPRGPSRARSAAE